MYSSEVLHTIIYIRAYSPTLPPALARLPCSSCWFTSHSYTRYVTALAHRAGLLLKLKESRGSMYTRRTHSHWKPSLTFGWIKYHPSCCIHMLLRRTVCLYGRAGCERRVVPYSAVRVIMSCRDAPSQCDRRQSYPGYLSMCNASGYASGARVSVARHQRDFVVILFVWKVMKKCLYNFTFLQWVGTVHKIILLFAHNWSQLLEYDHVKSFWIPYTLQIEKCRHKSQKYQRWGP